MVPLRLDPDQRFSCSQCGKCCRRFEIVISQAEANNYRKRNAAQWFREQDEGPDGAASDPFEPIPTLPGFLRIRKRADGACGFLSSQDRCRLHEELGARRKPLTCRLFPYRFHSAPDAIVVTTSFSCPTIAANTGEPIAEGEALTGIKGLRNEWFERHPYVSAPVVYVPGRAIDPDSLCTLRESLLQMLNRTGEDGRRDLRANVLRMAQSLDDLSRQRVLRLQDAAFAEYVSLTTRHAASTAKAAVPRPPGRVGRLLQRGFLFVVSATRLRMEHRSASRLALRLKLFRLLAHFHGLAPGMGRIRLGALRGRRVDVNAPDLQPLAYHYLRSSIESLGTGERPVLDEMAMAVSYLNAACALAVMNAAAAGATVDAAGFREALMEAVELTHSDSRGLLGRTLGLFAGGVESLYVFASPTPPSA